MTLNVSSARNTVAINTYQLLFLFSFPEITLVVQRFTVLISGALSLIESTRYPFNCGALWLVEEGIFFIIYLFGCSRLQLQHAGSLVAAYRFLVGAFRLQFPACMCMLSCFSWVRLFVILWTIAHQTPLSIQFSRQEYWSGLPGLPPGDLPNPGIEPECLTAPALAGGFFTTSATWEAQQFPQPGIKPRCPAFFLFLFFFCFCYTIGPC